MVYIGIDISKSSFVAAYPSVNGYRTKAYPNTAAGVRKFIATPSVAEHHCVMEATGNYGFYFCTCYIRAALPSVWSTPSRSSILPE